jgi:SIR2-like domain/TIR domain
VDATSDDARQHADVARPQVRVFINYRRDDTRGEARLLYDRLVSRFGAENLFLDVCNVQPGMKWLEEIRSQSGSCHIFLSLIGPRWISIMRAREQAALDNPEEDHVRSEILRAIKPNSGIHVIPVLVGDNMSLSKTDLPRSVRALGELQVAYVRWQSFEPDVAFLISRLEVIAREQPATPLAAVTARQEEQHSATIPAGTGVVVAAPDAAHYEDVLQQMVDEDNVVPFLGSRMTARRASAGEGPPSLPNNEELAEALAKRFGIKQAEMDLSEIAERVYVTRGRPDLYRALRHLLTVDCEPGPVHRFLARFPQMLEDLGLEKRYQLIVSTSFDAVLERAFDDESEPYDLAVYMASGPDRGKFVHMPFGGPPVPIDDPNSYTKLPIGLDYELQRTVIVKIHGAVDGAVGNYRWKDNYVITEDHYIDYLSKSPAESLVPVQVLDKLRESHCLFLGYPVGDWNLRVFLKRIWEGTLGARSWAVQPDPDVLEKNLWAQANVDLYSADLGDYVGLLRERLRKRTPESAGP